MKKPPIWIVEPLLPIAAQTVQNPQLGLSQNHPFVSIFVRVCRVRPVDAAAAAEPCGDSYGRGRPVSPVKPNEG